MQDSCEHCGNADLPSVLSDILVLNLKHANPTVEEALERLTIALRRVSELGIKAVILIHGYGSRGTGGHIKRAVHNALENNFFADRVDAFYFGEEVAYSTQAYHALIKRRPNLKDHLKYFKEGNAGMTILLMGSLRRGA
ncbi:Smr domain-containing protein [Polynucleobacter meluiroseus]|uniref:Smr domain-containing protein n=1 Tax=Polynucleobacter meluiroseus TaxID=1938814 RepID=A0A240E160_9BURK|nr:Smr/MutS family protein [Polynucleobacter meluiroseus]SNX28644.1 Smr domain-containing protein [Polynucleobacter meluiroseus]